MKQILFGIMMLSTFGLAAQPDDDTLAIKQQLKGNRVEFQYYGEVELYRVRDKATNKWGLYAITDSDDTDKGMVYTFVTYIAPECDELFWEENLPIVIARQGKKLALITAFNEKMQTVKPVYEFDDYRTKKQENKQWLLVKKNDRWGVMDPMKPREESLVVFPNEKEVPLHELTDEEKMRFKKAYTETQASLIRFSPEDPNLFRARHASNGKWGLYSYQIGKVQELIPMAYDSVSYLQPQNKYVIVYQGKKQGVHLSKGHYPDGGITVPIEFDELKSVLKNGKVYLAGRDEKQWGWINWYNGDMESDFNAKSFAELPEPEFEQAEGED